MERQLTSHDVN